MLGMNPVDVEAYSKITGNMLKTLTCEDDSSNYTTKKYKILLRPESKKIKKCLTFQKNKGIIILALCV